MSSLDSSDDRKVRRTSINFLSSILTFRSKKAPITLALNDNFVDWYYKWVVREQALSAAQLNIPWKLINSLEFEEDIDEELWGYDFYDKYLWQDLVEPNFPSIDQPSSESSSSSDYTSSSSDNSDSSSFSPYSYTESTHKLSAVDSRGSSEYLGDSEYSLCSEALEAEKEVERGSNRPPSLSSALTERRESIDLVSLCNPSSVSYSSYSNIDPPPLPDRQRSVTDCQRPDTLTVTKSDTDSSSSGFTPLRKPTKTRQSSNKINKRRKKSLYYSDIKPLLSPRPRSPRSRPSSTSSRPRSPRSRPGSASSRPRSPRSRPITPTTPYVLKEEDYIYVLNKAGRSARK